MAKLSKNQEKDHKKFFVDKGEIGFSPKRNKFIIDQTIALYDKELARRRKAFVNEVDDRADAIASFFSAINRGKESNLMGYFGKRELARLRGVEIMEEIMGSLVVKDRFGKRVTRPMKAEELVKQ